MTLTQFKPHIAFWSLIPLALAYGQWNKFGPFDNDTHDTPGIMHQMTFAKIVVTLFFIAGIVYWISKKEQEKSWTRTTKAHWILTTVGFLGFWAHSFMKLNVGFGQAFIEIAGYGRFDIFHLSFLMTLFAAQLLLFGRLPADDRKKRKTTYNKTSYEKP